MIVLKVYRRQGEKEAMCPWHVHYYGWMSEDGEDKPKTCSRSYAAHGFTDEQENSPQQLDEIRKVREEEAVKHLVKWMKHNYGSHDKMETVTEPPKWLEELISVFKGF